MKDFKGMFYFCLAVLLLVCAMVVYYAIPSRTVDFRGVIRDIAFSDDDTTVTICATSIAGGDVLFRIDQKSTLHNFDGEAISSSDLREGALIDVTYRKILFQKEDVHTVKLLRQFD